MQYTDEQIKAIEAEGRVIVSASAGSGKTKIMIERILRLVLSGKASVTDLLAVTFTNKAAFQMKERLRGALLDEIKSSTGEKRERLKKELDLLGLAEISTVHSFCGRLIRTYFYLLPEESLSPDYRVLTEQDAAGLQKKALSTALEKAFEKGEDSFKRVLDVHYRAKRKQALREVVKATFAKVSEFENGEEYLLRAGEDRFKEACAFLAKVYAKKADDVICELEKFKQACTKFPTLVKACDTLINDAIKFRDADTVFDMARATLTRLPNKPKDAGEELDRRTELEKLKTDFKKVIDDIKLADEEREHEIYLAAAEHARVIATLALDFGREYARLKREANALDYTDMQKFALALLEKEEVSAEVKKKYPFVFVDEYQDVNAMQEKIVSLMAGENLFLVGDEKQAIYGFRGSRSRYFREKRVEFGGALPLTENFRSASGILDAVNEIFAPVVEGYEEMRGGRLYAGNAGEIYSHRIEKVKEEKPVRQVYSVLSGSKANKSDALAESVARVVESERDKTFYDVESKSVKAVGYGDIAVLVRTSSEGERIAAALTARDIPVSTSTSVNVCDFFETRLLIDCLKYLDNEEADIPLAAVMRSSLGGFSDEDFMRIRKKYFDKSRHATFRAAAKSYAKEKDELAHRLNVFFRKAKRWRALAKVRTAAEVLNGLLAEGLEVEIASKDDGKNRLVRARRFVSEAEKCSGVHAFLTRLKESEEQVEFSESGGESAVKVLTMHKSKGLEFPVVILASMEYGVHSSQREEMEFSEAFLFTPRYYDHEKKTYCETIGRRAVKAEREEDENEGERNLLYVAMTRAKYRLHLMVEERRRALSPAFFTRYSDYFGDKFWGEELPVAPPVQPREVFDYESAGAEGEKERVLAAMQIGAEYPYRDSVYLPQKSSATALLKESRIKHEPQKRTQGASSTEEGTAYHKFLEHYRFGQSAKEELARMTGAGLFKKEEAEKLDIAQLERIAEIPALKALAGRSVEHEKKFLLSLSPKEMGRAEDDTQQVIFQGAIDLLFQDEGGYVIYDYKYSGLSADELKEKYAPQIDIYCSAVAKGKRVEKSTIRAKIINIRSAEEIDT